ncbi:hypothetical protein IMCC3317_39910 [Kordia antarctica]|uniref:Carboxypeptidase regulatory-like domain-containing protein n=1 Tax=Kordia antarctica TaxID=1218801 RepID=A0A7L4ZQ47_9FLAO|nr:hypothetical protein [Kordia antarctica]QHI38597.1 hypothetical protein IMCC3317_39910 [Kordia antarctica]
MKKSLTKYLVLFAVITVSILACQKDNEPLSETANSIEAKRQNNGIDTEHLEEALGEYKGRSVSANFVGRIIDENDQPIISAIVILGGTQRTTDENGIVTFMNATVNENFAYARVSAQGYTNGSRVMVPNHGNNSQNSFTIKLFNLESSQIIDSSGGEVIVETDFGGEVIVIFDDGFIDENGNSYTGNVSVNLNYLNPLNEDMANTMPGELYGLTANYEEVALGSYGMVNVELTGSSGEKLQITNPAKIHLPIHPDQLAIATNQVPMWSFNEDTGVWFEETVANKNGSHYIAEVNHFSFWNCDAPFPVVNFSATVTDASTGNAVVGLKVTISYNGFSRFAVTNSSSSGNVSGKIPSGQVMSITITDLCGTVLYTNTSFGPFNSATSITIPVNLTPNSAVNISGSVLNCASAPVTNGYVTYSNGGQFLATYLVNGGTHNYTAVSCSIPVNIDLVGADLSTGQTVVPMTVTANPSAIANLTACGGLVAEYIRYSVNGTPLQYDLLYPSGGSQGANNIYAAASSSNSGTYIYGNVAALGTYPYNPNQSTTTALAFEVFGDANGIDSNATVGITGAIQFTITSFGPIGTYIDIDFTGNYIDLLGNTNFVQGTAHIIRDF